MNMNALYRILGLLSLLSLEVMGAVPELITFDSGGKLARLIDQGDSIQVEGGFRVRLTDGTEHLLQGMFPKKNESLKRKGELKAWNGYQEVSEGTEIRFETHWEQEGREVVLEAMLEADASDEIESISYLVDVDRSEFLGGALYLGQWKAGLADTRTADGLFCEKKANRVIFETKMGKRRLEIEFGESVEVRAFDIWNEFWEKDVRRYRIEIPVEEAEGVDGGVVWRARIVFSYAGSLERPITEIAVGAEIDNGTFDGFGGNLCFHAVGEITDYLRDTLPMEWSRHQMKLQEWDEISGDTPGEALIADFEQIQIIEEREIPWIISIWRLPERFYTDPFERSPKSNRRIINPERWDELLDMMGAYLGYLKKEYAVEPDLLSFNEPNIGIGVLLTAEEHRDAVKRIGRYLKEHGYKTKMLLGDVTGPIGTYRYLLPTIKDEEAMKYAGGIAFHGWGGASAEEYSMWGAMKKWLGLPLFLSEAGNDAYAWRSGIARSHNYGIGEVREYLKTLHYAQPTSILYWQYVGDGYRMANMTESGEIERTSRYWMMKQLGDLTLSGSLIVSAELDLGEVEIAVLSKGENVVAHLLNEGPRREVEISGLNPGTWRCTVTNEVESMVERSVQMVTDAGKLRIELDPLSLTSLTLLEELRLKN